MYTIYIHRNKQNNKVYIGQTLKEPHRRWDNGNGYNRQLKFYNAIQKYGWDNFEHIIFMDNLTKAQADKYEKLLIALYNSTGENGYNISPGGDTPGGITQRKIVYQYSFDGTLVNKYSSQSEAARAVKTDQTNISQAVLGKRNTMCGFVWSSIPLSEKEVIKKVQNKKENSLIGQQAMVNARKKPVVEIDIKTGKILREFDSAAAAIAAGAGGRTRVYTDCKLTSIPLKRQRPTIFQYKNDNHFSTPGPGSN